MSSRRKPGERENLLDLSRSVNRDPSYPDRARIDSDVRAFLRPASSPWIVFDRDSRIDDFAKSALRIGAVFASSPNFVGDDRSDVVTSVQGNASALASNITLVEAPNMFPPSDPSADPTLEPSSVVVASDVVSEGPPPAPPRLAIESDPFAVPPGLTNQRKRVAWILGSASAGLVALAMVALLVVGSHHRKKKVTLARAVPIEPAVLTAEAAAIPPPPPVIELPAEPVAVPTAEEASAPPVTSAPASSDSTDSAPSKKQRLGRLTIKADPRIKNVWFDGKRMLGSGQRSFPVLCGMHTIAVNEKADDKDIEVPCNGEYVVSK